DLFQSSVAFWSPFHGAELSDVFLSIAPCPCYIHSSQRIPFFQSYEKPQTSRKPYFRCSGMIVFPHKDEPLLTVITITIGKNYINNAFPFAFDKFRENDPIFILS
ncbi:hypothetical protein STEG23_003912, partial [Scotinomys teguina]